MKHPKKLFSRIFYLLPRIMLISIPVIYIIFAFLTYFDYFESYIYPLRFIKGKAYFATPNIILGPYPHYEELKKLKENYKVSIVISLLNLNLPQEKALYEREKADAERLGIKTRSFPMEYLPLESKDNKKTLENIIQFITRNTGKKVYIHCYLGKHRVGFVKKGLTDKGIVYDKNTD